MTSPCGTYILHCSIQFLFIFSKVVLLGTVTIFPLSSLKSFASLDFIRAQQSNRRLSKQFDKGLKGVANLGLADKHLSPQSPFEAQFGDNPRLHRTGRGNVTSLLKGGPTYKGSLSPNKYSGTFSLSQLHLYMTAPFLTTRTPLKGPKQPCRKKDGHCGQMDGLPG